MTSKQRLLLIGIDDTDQKGSIGTGRQARMLLPKLVEIGCRDHAITRHQFLVDSRIPYTSHNSGACLAVKASADIQAIRDLCLSFLSSQAAKTAQPGLCIAYQDEVPDSLTCFGRSAQKQVLTIDQAQRLARQSNLWLQGLTSPAQGVIGALSCVGLRAGGNDGRFIHLADIRQAQGLMSVGQILDLGVDEILDHHSKPLDKKARVDTLDWIRPRLEAHRARLYLQRNPDDANIWIPVDRGKSRRISRSSTGTKQ